MYNLSKLAAGSVIVATAALGSAGVASADGYERKGKVVYERPSDWSGVYFGLSSGYQWSSIGVSNPAFPPGFTADHDSYLIGAHLGLQHQFGNIVVGVEGNWESSFRNNTGNFTCFAPGPQLTPGGLGNCGLRMDDVLSVGPRLGWAAGHWMPYVTGGYASAAYHFYGRTIATNTLNEEAKTRLQGWYIGGGVEWMVSPGWTAGIEYRHYDFNDATTAAFTPGGAFLELARFDASMDTVMARVSWKFNREVVTPLK